MFYDRMGRPVAKPRGVKALPRDSVYGICIREGKILLVRPVWIGVWELPGGAREEGESLIEALRREFCEETGYQISSGVKPVLETRSQFYADDINVFYDSAGYIFQVKCLGSPDITRIMKSEISGTRWFPMDGLSPAKVRNLRTIRKAALMCGYR